MKNIHIALPLAVLGLLAPTASATAYCPDDSPTQRFADWGDDAAYVEAPGGTFEDGLTWDSVGAPEIVTDANPFAFGPDAHSAVRLGPGDAITSPALCVSRLHPHMRFAARSVGPKTRLRVRVEWTDDNGKLKNESLSDLDPNHYEPWSLTKNIKLGKALPKGEAIRDIRLIIVADGGTGGWLVDSVYIDPMKSR